MERAARPDNRSAPLLHKFGHSFTGYYRLLAGIREAVYAKAGAAEYYDGLAELAPGSVTQAMLRRMREEERAHLLQLQELYTEMKGKALKLPEALPRPEQFHTGLKEAFVREAEGFRMLRKLVRQVPDPAAKELLHRMLLDELLHASELAFIRF
ncbi:hypothetical protein [Paenibacillus gansuensis]|uniref:Rubrerythrin diiron-binding domain-containing protein n=1 Tax=Paenibacillus gansuensis TaxID=306542 RepID=A0ABW5PD70_9BACL